MHSRWRKILKFTSMAVAISLFITSLLYGSGWRKVQAAVPQTDTDVRDFSLDPPRIESMAATPLSEVTPEGNALLMVRFAPEEELGAAVKTVIDDRDVLLHDDGTDGDEKGGDGTYSAVISLDFEALAQNQDRIQQLNAEPEPTPATGQTLASTNSSSSSTAVSSDQFINEPAFELRSEVGTKQTPIVDYRNVQPGQIVMLNRLGTFRAVDPERSLVIRDIKVVEDPTRTFNPCTKVGTPMGKWTFGYLMTQMANQPRTGITPSQFVRNWLNNWMNNQVINSFTAKQRQQIQQLVIGPWEQASGGPGAPLNLALAPFKLLAIVNRVDLRTNSAYGGGSAGEGRFVFGVMDMSGCTNCGGGPYPGGRGSCRKTQFTVILEYGIDRRGCEIRDWGRQWYNLSRPGLVLGSAQYNAELQAITDQFTVANAAPKKPNGSAINQVRSNEIALATALDPDWQMREFRLTPLNALNNGPLNEVTVVRTPDNSRNFTNVPLSDFVNTHHLPISNNTYSVPANWPFLGGPTFLGAASDVPNGIYWDGPNKAASIPDRQDRHLFSLNTCNSCHNRETNTAFTHIKPADFGTRADLSAFLTGCLPGTPYPCPTSPAPLVPDPADGVPNRSFNDLKLRAQLLDVLVNSPCFFDLGFVPLNMAH